MLTRKGRCSNWCVLPPLISPFEQIYGSPNISRALITNANAILIYARVVLLTQVNSWRRRTEYYYLWIVDWMWKISNFDIQTGGERGLYAVDICQKQEGADLPLILISILKSETVEQNQAWFCILVTRVRCDVFRKGAKEKYVTTVRVAV